MSKKMIELESALESLSILRSYLLDNARLQEEDYPQLARGSRSEAWGISMAMDALKKEAHTCGSGSGLDGSSVQ